MGDSVSHATSDREVRRAMEFHIKDVNKNAPPIPPPPFLTNVPPDGLPKPVARRPKFVPPIRKVVWTFNQEAMPDFK